MTWKTMTFSNKQQADAARAKLIAADVPVSHVATHSSFIQTSDDAPAIMVSQSHYAEACALTRTDGLVVENLDG